MKIPHAIYYVGKPSEGVCASCGKPSMLEFRDGDTEQRICRMCYDDVAMGCVIIREIEQSTPFINELRTNR